jgi:triphosphoribosyl-dephospho-CoA synthase
MELAALFRASCQAELDALKPGNVHRHAAGHGMTVADFVLSAEVAAPHLAEPSLGVGARILRAVEATRAACGQNTNLGILLLAAPLAAAAQAGGGLREALGLLLAGLGRADAVAVYRAIRLASPGGLGRSDRHDVADEPDVTLLEAMRSAAGRDRVAAQYAAGFRDVFELGVPRLQASRAKGCGEDWAMTATYLAFLAAFPDTHVVRRHGPAVGDEVLRRGRAMERLLSTAGADRAALHAELAAHDRELKARGINPGTSADLTVASHFAVSLLGAATHRQIE